MKLKYNFSGVILLIITFLVICFMFIFPYDRTISSFGSKTISEHSLIDMIGENWIQDLVTIPFWWPIFLILELSIIKKIEKVHIWIFLIQAFILGAYTFVVFLFLSLNLFSSVEAYYLNYYFIQFFLIFGVVANGIVVWYIGDRKTKKIERLRNLISIFKIE